ncbi:MAG: hypothetical protein Q8843_02530, partial [Candidatus Phytoplasma australasiaticum]|nr:hypothetical protein [Candidatus Phytoplasma australasiaticum]
KKTIHRKGMVFFLMTMPFQKDFHYHIISINVTIPYDPIILVMASIPMLGIVQGKGEDPWGKPLRPNPSVLSQDIQRE